MFGEYTSTPKPLTITCVMAALKAAPGPSPGEGCGGAGGGMTTGPIEAGAD